MYCCTYLVEISVHHMGCVEYLHLHVYTYTQLTTLHPIPLTPTPPSHMQLVLVLIGLMRYPVGSEADGGVSWEEMEKDEREERVDYRYKLVRACVRT